MEYITHNQDEHIIDETTWKVGMIKATFRELVDLFGKPGPGDEEKVDAEWRIKFSDGTVATVYNYKNGPAYCGKDGTPVERIKEWSIGGTGVAAADRVHIAVDLYRETKEASKKKRPFEEVFQVGVDMMDTLRATKGDNFARVVENALVVRKMGSLLSMIISRLVSDNDMPRDVASRIMDIQAEMSARIITNTAKISGVSGSDEDYAKEVMHWVEQLLDIEAKGAEEIVKEMRREHK